MTNEILVKWLNLRYWVSLLFDFPLLYCIILSSWLIGTKKNKLKGWGEGNKKGKCKFCNENFEQSKLMFWSILWFSSTLCSLCYMLSWSFSSKLPPHPSIYPSRSANNCSHQFWLPFCQFFCQNYWQPSFYQKYSAIFHCFLIVCNSVKPS